MTPELIALLTTYGIPALTFLIGHSQVLAPLIPNLPFLPFLSPKKPTDPAVRPIGQGGIIDLLGILAAQVIAHPTATPDQKATAVKQLADVSAVLTK